MLESKQEELLLHGPLKFSECIGAHYVTLMKLPYLLMVSTYPAVS